MSLILAFLIFWLFNISLLEVQIPDATFHSPNFDNHYYFTVKFHPIIENSPYSNLDSSHLTDPHYAHHDPVADEKHAPFYYSMAQDLEQTMPDSLECLGRSADLHNIYLFRTKNINHNSQHVLKSIHQHETVKWVGHESPKKKLFKRSPPLAEAEKTFKKMNISDPAFPQQWHLFDREMLNNDINVTGVWQQGITGKNVVVCVLDDGLDITHPDFENKFVPEASFDVLKKKPNFTLEFEDNHGTQCAGEVLGARNGVCGVGVAFDAKVSAIRLLDSIGEVTDQQEILAISFGSSINHIYSCSWGPSDTGDVMMGPSQVVTDALIKTATKGRNGLGSLLVFASGNGGAQFDNCNFDGYTNSPYTITIGATTYLNSKATYSEDCAGMLGVTYSSGMGKHIVTSLSKVNGADDTLCGDRFGGTSAAAPLVAGVLALVLEIRPDLTWRDAQYILIESTNSDFDETDEDWQTTTIGRKFNHKYGFGHIDAYQAVEVAKNWSLVGNHTIWRSHVATVHQPFTFSKNATHNGWVKSVINVTESHLASVNMTRLEHVTVTVHISHNRGEVLIQLVSPNNITSTLATPRSNDLSKQGFQNWTMMTIKHWNEHPIIGNWTLKVSDSIDNQVDGVLHSWSMKLWGEVGEFTTNEEADDENTTKTFLHSFLFTLTGYLVLVAMAVTLCQLFWYYLVNRKSTGYSHIAPSELTKDNGSQEKIPIQNNENDIDYDCDNDYDNEKNYESEDET